MNIKDFNALENKTLGHVIIYFYHNESAFDSYVFCLNDIYRMGLELNSFYSAVESGYRAIIEHLQQIGRNDQAESFEEYLDYFKIAQWEHRGPLQHWDKSCTSAFQAFYDVMEFSQEILCEFSFYTFGDIAYQTIYENISNQSHL